jgi:AcrR family transcriptional regulator
VTRSRRRGDTLETAIFEATLAELVDTGYGRLTMEGIAARARTGKAALYRRWPTKHALVLAALRHALPPSPEPRADRTARQNLLAVFAAHCDVLAGRTAFPGLHIMGQLLHEPELRSILAEDLIAPRLAVIESILRNGECSGEIDLATLSPLAAKIGPALIVQHVLLTGAPPNRRELRHIVDTVIPPSAHDSSPQGSRTPRSRLRSMG